MNDDEPEHSPGEIRGTSADLIFTVLSGEYYETDAAVVATVTDEEEAITLARTKIDRSHYAEVWKTYLDRPDLESEFVTSEFVE